MIKQCIICNNTFEPILHGYNRIVCFEKKCIKEKKKRDKSKERLKKYGCVGYRERECVICNKIFKPKTSTQKSCSEGCKKIRDNQNRNESQKKYHKQRKNTDIEYIAKRKIRLIVGKIIGYKRRGKSIDIVGYTPDDFRGNIENQFKPGMSWDNYGEWHIDHIRPLCSFRFKNNEGSIDYGEVKKSMALKNLQPLWAIENLIKSGKYDY